MTGIIFTRLFFSIGLGVLFAVLGYSFLPANNKLEGLFRRYFRPLLIGLVIVVTMYWWLMSALRHWAMRTAGVDLGYFANILWTTLHGNFLAAAIAGGSAFGWHFSPSLALLAIPYAIWQDPLWLMGMQAVFTASGAVALALTAGRLGMSRSTSLLVAMLWLLSPVLRGAMFYDFHEIGMVAGLIAWIVYFVVSGRGMWALILALVAMGFKEDAPIYIGCLGIILALSYKKSTSGWIMVIMAVAYYLLVQTWLWDWIAPHHRDYISVRFPQIHGNEGLLGAVLGNPMMLFTSLCNWDRLWGLIMLLLPVLFLPFRRWGGLGLLPALWLFFSMSIFGAYIFSLHYAAPIFALVITAAIPALPMSFRLWKTERRFAGLLMLGFTLSLTLAQPPLTVFSQFDPAAWRPHPRLGMIQKVATETNPGDSLTADKLIAPHFTNHEVFKEFPSNLLTDNFFLSNNSMGCPQMPLLMADLGYRLKFDDPLYWFLTRKARIDAKKQFMDRLRWMETESCSLPSWDLKPDEKASLGSAVYLPENEGYGERIVITPGLLLPPGSYSFFIRIRTGQRPVLQSGIFAEVRFHDFDGDEKLIVGAGIPIDAGFASNGYHDVKIHFYLGEWGRTYINLNFGIATSYWFDGYGVEGLPLDFDTYYHALFPQPLELSSVCTQPRMLVGQNDGLTQDALDLTRAEPGQVIARWQMKPNLQGKFIIIALVEAEGTPSFMTLALINAKWQSGGVERQHTLGKINLVDQHDWMRVPHLEYSTLDIPPHAVIELVAAPELEGRVKLRKLWLTQAPMWSFR